MEQASDSVRDGNVLRFEPRINAEAVIGVSLNADDGTLILALRGRRGVRSEVAMPIALAEVVVAAIDRALSQARSAPPAP